MSKLLCYELNEVPWRVVDHYLERRPDSHLATLLSRSAQFTTYCNDRGELQPWSTWPTLHRGVSNEVHAIDFLNQDLSPAAAWPPVWDLLTDADVSTGVFGSLQSYPPREHPFRKFHIPDTFAAGPETIPSRYTAFQAFNLKQTGENKAVASSVGAGDLPNAFGLLRAGIRASTGVKVARHLLAERREPLHKSRRALLQPELAFDAFISCMHTTQPDFVTFFSNHVAGILHRYWKYAFPEDFGYTLSESGTDRFHAESTIAAMDIFDKQLGKLMAFARQHDYSILIISSMGQEAIDRGDYIDELTLNDLPTLLRAVGIEHPVQMNLAMQPDVAFVFDSVEQLDDCRQRLFSVTDMDGMPLFEQRYAEVGTTLNLALRSSRVLMDTGTAKVSGVTRTLGELGLSLLHRDQGTGYHQPEGILVWEHLSVDSEPRAVMDSRCIAPSLLTYFGVPTREYMQPAFVGPARSATSTGARTAAA